MCNIYCITFESFQYHRSTGACRNFFLEMNSKFFVIDLTSGKPRATNYFFAKVLLPVRVSPHFYAEFP